MGRNNGSLLHSRSLYSHALWKEDRVFSKFEAWVDLIRRASFADQEVLCQSTIVKLKRGQLLTSHVNLAKAWKWSRNKVRRFLSMLESEHMIEQQTNQRWTIITLCNYNKYQSFATYCDTTDDTANDTATGQPTIQQQDSDGTTDDTHITKYKLNLEPKVKLKKMVKQKAKPLFDPSGKKKYLDHVYLDDNQYESVKKYYLSKGCTEEDLQEGIRELDRWFEDNPKKRAARTDDGKALKGWPFDKALARRKTLAYAQQNVDNKISRSEAIAKRKEKNQQLLEEIQKQKKEKHEQKNAEAAF